MKISEIFELLEESPEDRSILGVEQPPLILHFNDRIESEVSDYDYVTDGIRFFLSELARNNPDTEKDLKLEDYIEHVRKDREWSEDKVKSFWEYFETLPENHFLKKWQAADILAASHEEKKAEAARPPSLDEELQAKLESVKKLFDLKIHLARKQIGVADENLMKELNERFAAEEKTSGRKNETAKLANINKIKEKLGLFDLNEISTETSIEELERRLKILLEKQSDKDQVGTVNKGLTKLAMKMNLSEGTLREQLKLLFPNTHNFNDLNDSMHTYQTALINYITTLIAYKNAENRLKARTELQKRYPGMLIDEYDLVRHETCNNFTKLGGGKIDTELTESEKYVWDAGRNIHSDSLAAIISAQEFKTEVRTHASPVQRSYQTLARAVLDPEKIATRPYVHRFYTETIHKLVDPRSSRTDEKEIAWPRLRAELCFFKRGSYIHPEAFERNSSEAKKQNNRINDALKQFLLTNPDRSIIDVLPLSMDEIDPSSIDKDQVCVSKPNEIKLIRGCDLFLVSCNSPDLSDNDKLKAENSKTPILMRVNNQFYIYGCTEGGKKWDLTRIPSSPHLRALPFDKKILRRSDERFNNLLVDTLSAGHHLFGKPGEGFFYFYEIAEKVYKFELPNVDLLWESGNYTAFEEEVLKVTTARGHTSLKPTVKPTANILVAHNGIDRDMLIALREHCKRKKIDCDIPEGKPKLDYGEYFVVRVVRDPKRIDPETGKEAIVAVSYGGQFARTGGKPKPLKEGKKDKHHTADFHLPSGGM